MRYAGLSQSEIATKTGTSRASVNAWCLGKSFPTRENLGKLASALGVKVDLLLGQDQGGVSELLTQPGYLEVYRELLEMQSAPPEVKQRQLWEVAEFIRYVRNRVPS